MSERTKIFTAAWVATTLFLFASLSRSASAEQDEPSSETTNMTVVVKEYDTGQPISQAHVTLEFFVPHGNSSWRKPKKIFYNAKTDMEGRCKLPGINKGPIVLMVTEPEHQTYGKKLRLEKDNQVFEVKLKKPQPLR